MDPKNLPGALKAAILIRSMDKTTSEKLLGQMEKEERRLVESHIRKIGQLPPALVEKIAREFTLMLESGTASGPPGRDNSIAAQGKNVAPGGNGAKNGSLKMLQSLEPREIVDLIQTEHPQTIAIIAAHLSTRAAGQVLSLLPDELKTEVSLRIAGLDKIQAGLIDEIEHIFENIMKKRNASAFQKIGGVESLAEILNQTEGASGKAILEGIKVRNPDLASAVKQKMFVFDDIVAVDDRGFQQVLRHLDSAGLALALKVADDEIREKVFRNMSERAGEMLKEEIETLGAVRMSEVLGAQAEITAIIQDMEEKGEIVIQGRGGEEFIA